MLPARGHPAGRSVPPARSSGVGHDTADRADQAGTMASHLKAGWLDVSANAGVLLGAHASATSYQPNLLSRAEPRSGPHRRGLRSTAYGFGTAIHSFLRSLPIGCPGPARQRRVERVPADRGRRRGHRRSGRNPRAAAGAGRAGTRSLARLAAATTAATAVAGVGADLIELAFPSPRRTADHTGGDGGHLGRVLRAHPSRKVQGRVGPTADGSGPRGRHQGGLAADGHGHGPHGHRQHARAWRLVESALSTAFARVAAQVLGGTADDRRTAGRALDPGRLRRAGLGRAALGERQADHARARAWSRRTPPRRRSPRSPAARARRISWTTQSRESRRWLSMALQPQDISHVMGEPARQPIRVYASLESAPRRHGAGRAAARRDRPHQGAGTARLRAVLTDRVRLRQLRRHRDAGVPDQGRLRLGGDPVLGAAVGAVAGQGAPGHRADPHRGERHRPAAAGHARRPTAAVLPVRREPRLAGQPGDVRGAGAFRAGRHRAGRRAVDRHPGGDGVAAPRSTDAGHHPRPGRAATASSSPGAPPGLDRAVRRRPGQRCDTCCCRTGTIRSRSSRRRCCGVAPAGWARTRPGRTAPPAAPAGCR